MQDHDFELYREVRTSIKAGDLPAVERLLGGNQERLRMDTPFGTWLHMAASHGRLAIVRWLVSQGVDVDAVGGIGDNRPLDLAAAEGNVEVVKCLLEAGAKLDVSESIRNPLVAVIVGGDTESHTAVAKMLIDRGIDTTRRYPNLDNMDALEYAKEWGRTEIAKLLEAL